MVSLPFIKMHGCGNDYVFLDCFLNPAPEDPRSLARVVSDRHRSIGSDGLVLMLPCDLPGVVARMKMFNADGSEGVMCGNALRCMAMWLHQSGRCGTMFQIAMAERLVDVEILSFSPERRTATVKVILGEPGRINLSASGRASFAQMISLTGVNLPPLIVPPIHVTLGNPHTVLFVDSLDTVNLPHLGPLIESHPIFPDRTNVEFAEVIKTDSVRVRVWERGSGETLACGSGACAVGVAGICRDLFSADGLITTAMAGGDLRVRWDSGNRIHLEGPAVEAFRGVVKIHGSNSCEPSGH